MALTRLQMLSRSSRFFYPTAVRLYSNDEGAIRQAGGSFSKREKAQEDQYFRKLEQEQLEKIKQHAKEHHEEEITHHEDAIKELHEQITRHQEKIRRHKEKLETEH